MESMLKTIFRSEDGQDLIEYGLLGAFISVSAIAILRIIGVPITAMFQSVLDALS